MIDRIMDYVVSYVFVAGDIIHSRGGRILLYWVWCHTVCSCLGSINIMCVQGVLLYVGTMQCYYVCVVDTVICVHDG